MKQCNAMHTPNRRNMGKSIARGSKMAMVDQCFGAWTLSSFIGLSHVKVFKSMLDILLRTDCTFAEHVALSSHRRIQPSFFVLMGLGTTTPLRCPRQDRALIATWPLVIGLWLMCQACEGVRLPTLADSRPLNELQFVLGERVGVAAS